MFIVRAAEVRTPLGVPCLSIPVAAITIYDVALHRTPNGVRGPLLLSAINITPLAGWCGSMKHRTLAFSCGARSAFNLGGSDCLRSMLSRRQLQGFVMRRGDFHPALENFRLTASMLRYQNTTA